METFPAPRGTTLLNKVPEVTVFFWVIKVLATTVGETAADFLNVDLHFGLGGTSLAMSGLLALVLFAQMRAPRYRPWLYWATVVAISVVGTLITDNLTDGLGVPLALSTGAFGGALLLTFVVWYWREGTLSIHAVDSRSREAFYWLAILFTFALGTAAGDLMGERLGLGYANAALLFAGLIAVTALAYYRVGANPVASFWVAYIITRPLGASCGDLLSQPLADGGLGLGAASTSALFLAVILSLVAYLTVSGRDIITDRSEP